jgi:hydroxymethylpyrimidine kinase/phosphomethylpyrimidine kinase
MRGVLTIAGSDSGGGAGVQADLKTFAAFGVYGASALTAVTAQNTRGVAAVAPLPADLVTSQIEAVASDIALHATKIGMLATAAIVEAVAAAIQDLQLPLVVVDPVLVSSSGDRLLDEDGIQTLRLELLRHALVVTPNIPEAEVLSGCRIAAKEDLRRAAGRIHDMCGAAVIVTGGHASASRHRIVDLLFDGDSFAELEIPRAAVEGVHGTGCTHASALAAALALGEPLAAAAATAQKYVAGAIVHAMPVGGGARVLNHFWQSPRARGTRA